jgi:hypothetical protein
MHAQVNDVIHTPTNLFLHLRTPPYAIFYIHDPHPPHLGQAHAPCLIKAFSFLTLTTSEYGILGAIIFLAFHRFSQQCARRRLRVIKIWRDS